MIEQERTRNGAVSNVPEVEKWEEKPQTFIVFKGKEREVILGKERAKVRPFVEARRVFEDIFESGVGVVSIETNEGYFWGLIEDVDLIGGYRAMKIVESLDTIDSRGDLCYAHYAALREIHPSNRDRVDKITSRIGEEAREEILKMIPSNLEQTITNLQEKGVPINGWVLEREIKAGTLKNSPVIESAIEDSRRRGEEARKKLEKSGVLKPKRGNIIAKALERLRQLRK